MITAEIILDTRRKTKKGFPVKIRVYDAALKKHDYINLKLYQNNDKLKSDNFIKQREFLLIKELDFVNSRNFKLDEAITVFKNGIPITDIQKRILELESELSHLKSQFNPTMLFEFSERYLNEKSARKELIILHTAVLKKFGAFILPKQDIAINDLKTELLIDFQMYLSEKLTSESVNGYIKKFQSIFNEAQRREDLNIKLVNPFKNIKDLAVNKDFNKSISLDSLKKIQRINFDHWIEDRSYKYKRVIDLFLFQIAIGGHDLVDIALLKWDNIKDGRVSFKRYKNKHLNSGGATINNKLFSFALKVIENYGTKENKRVFSFIPEPSYDCFDYETFQQNNYNKILKIVREKLNISEVIMSKRSRYTFNTIAGNLLISRDIIEEIQGHSQSSISHGYYGGTFNEIKDAEHLKVIQYVFGE